MVGEGHARQLFVVNAAQAVAGAIQILLRAHHVEGLGAQLLNLALDGDGANAVLDLAGAQVLEAGNLALRVAKVDLGQGLGAPGVGDGVLHGVLAVLTLGDIGGATAHAEAAGSAGAEQAGELGAHHLVVDKRGSAVLVHLNHAFHGLGGEVDAALAFDAVYAAQVHVAHLLAHLGGGGQEDTAVGAALAGLDVPSDDLVEVRTVVEHALLIEFGVKAERHTLVVEHKVDVH